MGFGGTRKRKDMEGIRNKERVQKTFWDFPGDAVVKNPPANTGDTGSILGLGRSHMPQSN